MRRLGVVIAEVDRELRYVWIDNPHPDFAGAVVVGKRDDELIPESEARGIMQLKQEVWKKKRLISRVLVFNRRGGPSHYNLTAYPIVGDANSKIEGILTLGFETTLPDARR